MMQILLWGSCIWLVPLMYVFLNNETKFKKNLAVGVTIPYSGRTDPEVCRFLEQFRKRLKGTCLGLVLLALCCLPFRDFGVSMTLFLIWVDLVIVCPHIPYVICNQKLKELKIRRGWKAFCREETEVNLPDAGEKKKWLSPASFLLPFLCSLIPLVSGRELWVFYGLNGCCILLFWGIYRWMYRSKAEAVDENVELTEALTGIRRYNWGKCWMICAWCMAALNLGMWLTEDYFWLNLLVTMGISILMVMAVIRVEMRVRRLQEELTQESGRGFYVDEDDKWIWGLFYYDPYDSNLLVNDRVGMNVSFNLAKRTGKIIMGILVILLLGMPFLGVWLSQEEKAPVTLNYSEEVLTGGHSHTSYEIPLDEIEKIELVEEEPRIKKISGTGMDSVKKGNYRSQDWGKLKVCIDPRTGPWLLVETKDGSLYLFGSSKEGETERIYKEYEDGRD